jgi:hypothetical protein
MSGKKEGGKGLSELGKPMTQVECPFCSNPNFFADATKGRAKKIKLEWPRWRLKEKFWSEKLLKINDDYGRVTKAAAEQRGECIRIVLDGDNFQKRWQGFTVEVFGIDYPRELERFWSIPPAPFLFATGVFQKSDQAPLVRQFFACRLTHQKSAAQLIVHWWPTHGRLFEMHGPLVSQEPNADIEAFKKAFDFFRRETRGAPKIDAAKVTQAIRSQGQRATQKKVAQAVGAADRTLRDWLVRNGKTWKELKNELVA